MARKALTPEVAKRQTAAHIKASREALKVLSSPLPDDVVCDCDDGNSAGITPAECGCAYAEAAKTLEAAGCYIRRAAARGLLA